MKHIFLKTALAALLIGGVATSCINDLNISSIDRNPVRLMKIWNCWRKFTVRWA